MRRIIIGLAMVTTSWSAMAEDPPAKDPEVVRLERETALLAAQAARETAAASVTTAATARIKAQTDALGIPATDGKTTLGANAGAMEIWMLSASTADAAAVTIARDLARARRQIQPLPTPVAPAQPDVEAGPPQPPAPGRPVSPAVAEPLLVIGSDEALELTTGSGLATRVVTASNALKAAHPPCFDTKPTTGSATGGAFPIAAIGAIAGLLKTDTEITGIDVPMGNRMLVAAVARRVAAEGILTKLPSSAVAVDLESPLAAAWADLLAARDKAKTCRADLARRGKTKWFLARVAALDAAVTSATALESEQTKADEQGRTPLVGAIRSDSLLAGNPAVLRVQVEKGGGSLLKRSNLWTALGAPAVGITGGLVVSYTVTQPRTGLFITGGAIVCRTALTNLGAVQSGRVSTLERRKRADCNPLFANMEPSETGASR